MPREETKTKGMHRMQNIVPMWVVWFSVLCLLPWKAHAQNKPTTQSAAKQKAPSTRQKGATKQVQKSPPARKTSPGKQGLHAGLTSPDLKTRRSALGRLFKLGPDAFVWLDKALQRARQKQQLKLLFEALLSMRAYKHIALQSLQKLAKHPSAYARTQAVLGMGLLRIAPARLSLALQASMQDPDRGVRSAVMQVSARRKLSDTLLRRGLQDATLAVRMLALEACVTHASKAAGVFKATHKAFAKESPTRWAQDNTHKAIARTIRKRLKRVGVSSDDIRLLYALVWRGFGAAAYPALGDLQKLAQATKELTGRLFLKDTIWRIERQHKHRKEAPACQNKATFTFPNRSFRKVGPKRWLESSKGRPIATYDALFCDGKALFLFRPSHVYLRLPLGAGQALWSRTPHRPALWQKIRHGQAVSNSSILTRALLSSNPKLRERALWAALRMGAAAKPQIPTIRKLLYTGPMRLRLMAAWFMIQHKRVYPGMPGLLHHALRSKELVLRINSALALLALGESPKNLMPHLQAIMKHPKERHRVGLMQRLSQTPKKLPALTPILQQGLKDTSWKVQLATLKTASLSKKPIPALLPAIQMLQNSHKAPVRLHATHLHKRWKP